MLSEYNPGAKLSEDRVPRRELDDSALWQNFADGNDLAFSIIYKRHVQPLYNYGMHACGNKDMTLACLQQLFAALQSRKGARFNGRSFKCNLVKTFRHILLDRTGTQLFSELRSEPSPLPIVTATRPSFIPNNPGHGFGALNGIEREVSSRQREAIILRFCFQLTYREIAVILHAPGGG